MTVHRNRNFYNKINRHTNFQILFWYLNPHVSDSFSAHHQELSTVHSALVHVIQVWRQLACRIRMELYNMCQCRMYSR